MALVKLQDVLTTAPDSDCKAPKAVFIESVPAFLKEHTLEADVLNKALHELNSKYVYLRSSLSAQLGSYEGKMPEMEEALSLVAHLKKARANAEETNEPVEMSFQLAETIYGQATTDLKSGKVLLWIGANCMLEYTYDEALELLGKNLAAAKEQVAILQKDLRLLRDSETVTQVNVARVHNHGVELRAEKAKLAAENEA